MLDLGYLRENLNEARQRLSNRGFALDVEPFERLDTERKTLILEAERLRQIRNSASESIAQLMKQKVDATEKRNEVKAVSQKLKDIEESLSKAENELFRFAATIPNLPDPDVPIGQTDEQNVVVRRYGEPTKFN